MEQHLVQGSQSDASDPKGSVSFRKDLVLDFPVPVDAAGIYGFFSGARVDVLVPSGTGSRFVSLRIVLANGDGSARHGMLLLRSRAGDLVRYHAWDPAGRMPVASFAEDDPAIEALISGFGIAQSGLAAKPLSPGLCGIRTRVRSGRVAALSRWADVFEEFDSEVVEPAFGTLPGLGRVDARFADAGSGGERLVLVAPDGLRGLSEPRRLVAQAAVELLGVPGGGPGLDGWIGKKRKGPRRPFRDILGRREGIRTEGAPPDPSWDD